MIARPNALSLGLVLVKNKDGSHKPIQVINQMRCQLEKMLTKRLETDDHIISKEHVFGFGRGFDSGCGVVSAGETGRGGRGTGGALRRCSKSTQPREDKDAHIHHQGEAPERHEGTGQGPRADPGQRQLQFGGNSCRAATEHGRDPRSLRRSSTCLSTTWYPRSRRRSPDPA